MAMDHFWVPPLTLPSLGWWRQHENNFWCFFKVFDKSPESGFFFVRESTLFYNYVQMAAFCAFPFLTLESTCFVENNDTTSNEMTFISVDRDRLLAYRDRDGEIGAVEQDHAALQVVFVELPHPLPLLARQGSSRGRGSPSRRRRSPFGPRGPQVAVALEGAGFLIPSRLVPLREESQHYGGVALRSFYYQYSLLLSSIWGAHAQSQWCHNSLS